MEPPQPRHLRILLVCSRFPPAIGGAETHAHELSLALARRGHEVSILTSDVDTVSPFSRVRPARDPPIAPASEMGQIDVCRRRGFPVLPGVSSLGVLAPRFILLRSDVRKFDVIHAYSYGYSSSFLPGFSPRRSGLPFVITPLVTREGPLLRKIYDRTFGRSLVRAADQVVALTNIERDYLSYLGVPATRLTVVASGIDLVRMRKRGGVRNETMPHPQHARVIFVGRIAESKGIAVLVHAMKRVSAVLPEATLEIVGPDGGFLRSVRELVAELNLDRVVHFLGTLGAEDVYSQIAEADVLVLPSIRGEAQGIVMMEGMALRTPVIGTNTGGIPETLGHGEFGLLVPPGDPESLGKAILSVLKGEVDVDGMRSKALAWVTEHDWDWVGAKIEEIYFKAIASQTA
jgi:glycosyltransferase involved in cell wall biosynthesis